MDLALKGKTALVTGSSSGIGAAIAKELATEGVVVAVHGRDRTRTEQTVREINETGGCAPIAVVGDLSVDEDATLVAEQTEAALGNVDILVNNAGGLVRMDNPEWQDVSVMEWLHAFDKNIVAAVRLIRYFVPTMKDRGWGRIINISSISGSHINGNQIEYGAAKAALNNVTVGLAKILGIHGITVNAIAPGTIMTPAVEKWLEVMREQNGWGDDLAENERRYTTELLPQPILRLGRPREIAAMVALLASPLSDYTTGAHIRIDGGSGCGV
jgi:3-oxoacyl-[acyl-carrier protein] reductase